MKKGCALTFLLWAVFAGAYAWVAWPIIHEVAPTAIVAVLGGTITGMFVGAVVGLFTGGGDRAALERAKSGEPMKDGRLEAASGAIRPLGAPLEAPFSGEPCVAYEYDVKAPGGGKSDYAGVALTPSQIEDPRGPAKLLGWAMLDEFPAMQNIDRERADAYLKAAPVEPLGVTGILSVLTDLAADDDGAIRRDFRIGQPEPTVQGKRTEEKILPPGQHVTLLGIWSEERRGFATGGKFAMNRIFPMDLDTAAKQLGGNPVKTLGVAFVFFLGLHIILVPMYFLGRANLEAKQGRSRPTPEPSAAPTTAPLPTRPLPAVAHVTVENGRPLAEDSEALAIVKRYLEAVQTGDVDTMSTLVPGTNRTGLADGDLFALRMAHPAEVKDAGGWENDEAATIRVEGPSAQGKTRIVLYDLHRTFEGWRIWREQILEK